MSELAATSQLSIQYQQRAVPWEEQYLGQMVQLYGYVKCSYPHLRRHRGREEVITMWRMPTCDIITRHCSNLGQGTTNVAYIFKENYSDNKCSMSECIWTILWIIFNVISPEKGKGHTFTFVSECDTALPCSSLCEARPALLDLGHR